MHTPGLQGAWREGLQFTSGPFAEVKDLQFMLVFNRGGTMTESSNYDGVPPVPPAYGIWRKSGPATYEAQYEFFMTKMPGNPAELIKTGGFPPAGRGLLSETITLAKDSESYTSVLSLVMPDGSTSAATGTGLRMRFPPAKQ
ncbi:MAG TPA: hypothetical protein VEH07_03165 [Alphaproteobacteria bacterium]|nr:hypothetical protein [Alphaproteobacteria bacterium]